MKSVRANPNDAINRVRPLNQSEIISEISRNIRATQPQLVALAVQRTSIAGMLAYGAFIVIRVVFK
jgi:hypothetical protein